MSTKAAFISKQEFFENLFVDRIGKEPNLVPCQCGILYTKEMEIHKASFQYTIYNRYNMTYFSATPLDRENTYYILLDGVHTIINGDELTSTIKNADFTSNLSSPYKYSSQELSKAFSFKHEAFIEYVINSLKENVMYVEDYCLDDDKQVCKDLLLTIEAVKILISMKKTHVNNNKKGFVYSSIKAAKMMSKNHKDVLRFIRSNIDKDMYLESKYIDKGNNVRNMILLNKKAANKLIEISLKGKSKLAKSLLSAIL